MDRSGAAAGSPGRTGASRFDWRRTRCASSAAWVAARISSGRSSEKLDFADGRCARAEARCRAHRRCRRDAPRRGDSYPGGASWSIACWWPRRAAEARPAMTGQHRGVAADPTRVRVRAAVIDGAGAAPSRVDDDAVRPAAARASPWAGRLRRSRSSTRTRREQGRRLEGRSGFSRMADAVAYGEAGGVFAVEVSRMARSSEDWRRLLVLCGRGRGGGRRRAADLRPERPRRQAPLGTEGDDVGGGDPLAAAAPAGRAAAQGAPRSPEDAGLDGIPVGRAGLRDGPRRGGAAGGAASSFSGTTSSRVRGRSSGGRARRASRFRRAEARRTGTLRWSGKPCGSRACTKS